MDRCPRPQSALPGGAPSWVPFGDFRLDAKGARISSDSCLRSARPSLPAVGRFNHCPFSRAESRKEISQGHISLNTFFRGERKYFRLKGNL
ncbi:MAG: hypothetical protein AMK70_15585 [Nitrospira bacterium SG8_35_1]|nr:MAG: hypothetical protein AMK70_15585 [Nitrospira bacterium SG8_35_1]